MHQWKSIYLKNVGVFKETEFEIPKGITTIYGTSNGNANVSNANGKSMLFTSIFDTIFDTPVGAEKSDRIQHGTRGVELKLHGNKTFRLLRDGRKAMLDYDGTKTTGITNVRKKVSEIFPWTWEDIITYVHLDAQQPHPLVKGSNAHRKEFLSSFFELNRIDAEKAIIKQELAVYSKYADEYSQLIDELKEIRKQQPDKEDYIEIQTRRIAKMQASLDKLQEQSESIELRRRAALFADQASVEIEHYKAACDEVGSKKLSIQRDYYEKLIEKEQEKLSKAEAYEEHQIAQAKYEDWVHKLSSSTKEFLKSGKAVDTPYRKIANRVESNASEIRRIKRLLEDLEPKCSKKIKRLDEPRLPYREALAKRETARHQLEHAKKFGKGECPTCGQSVSIKNPDQLRENLRKLNAIIDAWGELNDAKDAIEERAKHRERYTELSKELDALIEFNTKNKKYCQIADELANMVEPPKPYTGPKLNAAITKKVIAELESRLKAINFLLRNKEVLGEVLSFSKDKDGLDVDTSQLQQVAELSRKLTQATALLDTAKSLAEQSSELKARLKKLKPKVAKARMLEKLLTGYDDKAMKKLVIQAISTRLGQQINKYAKLAFADDFRFELVWDTTQVQFLVHRHYGKRVLTSDVRRLSGAETKKFTLVLVLALLCFVPTSKRSNMLILDEPTASMGESSIEQFKELLPVLNSVIPSIIIITPKTDQRYGGREYTIANKNGVTTLVEGHPFTLEKQK